jgi:hypothetical protein
LLLRSTPSLGESLAEMLPKKLQILSTINRI